VDQEIVEFIDEVVNDAEQPVVVFALEWCEFCWSVRKFFDKVNIPYRAIDLDSVAFQQDQRGRRIRNLLAERTAMHTIPQIFIGGTFVGGCTDIFDAWNDGKAQELLHSSGVEFAAAANADPYSFLPEWLHPR
jgi:cysteine synthase A